MSSTQRHQFDPRGRITNVIRRSFKRNQYSNSEYSKSLHDNRSLMIESDQFAPGIGPTQHKYASSPNLLISPPPPPHMTSVNREPAKSAAQEVLTLARQVSWTSKNNLVVVGEKGGKKMNMLRRRSSTKSLSALDMLERSQKEAKAQNSVTSKPSGKSKLRNKLFKSKSKSEKSSLKIQQGNNNEIENIGLKLALPSTIDIMTGKAPIERRDELESRSFGNEATGSQYMLRSSEVDPSKHQVSIPIAEQFLMHSRICALLETCQSMDPMFDFNRLKGMTRQELEGMYSRLVTVPQSNVHPPTYNSASNKQRNVHKIVPHPSLLKCLFECGEDIVIEGHFTGEKNSIPSSDSLCFGLQVVVFSSQRHRQFIVCYIGSPEQQMKPISAKSSWNKGNNSGNMSDLHPSHPVPVHPLFHECYFSNDVEKQLFKFLSRLTAKNPFCDVVTTGHSFGGGLAMIGAVRFAALYPMMMVSCHVYGIPRVGGNEFRQLGNSLPNLKVMRVENGSDPFVSLPEGNSKWAQPGHTITLNEEPSPQSPTAVADDSNGVGYPSGSIHDIGLATNVSYVALAYRFDEKRRGAPLLKSLSASSVSSKMGGKKAKKMKRDHEIRAYVQSLEKFTHMGFPWVTKYVGEEGRGISGISDEERCVV